MPQGPSGQPPEACGGPVSPLLPNSEAEVPEGKERVKWKSPEEEVWDGKEKEKVGKVFENSFLCNFLKTFMAFHLIRMFW